MYAYKIDDVVKYLLIILVTGLVLFLLTTPHYELALVPALAIIGMLGLSKKPIIGYYLIVLVIPFGAFRSIGGSEYLRIHWIAAFCLLVILGFEALSHKRLPAQVHSSMWWKYLLYLVMAAIAALLSPYGMEAVKDFILLMIGGLYIGLTMIYVGRKQLFSSLPRLLVLSVGIGSLLAALGFFFNISFFAEKTQAGLFKRGLGGTEDPNNQALMIIYTLPLLGYWFFRARSALSRIAALLIFSFDVLGMVTTYSRGGALIMGSVLLAVLFQNRRFITPRNLGLLFSGVAIGLALALLIIPASYWERQKSLVTAEDLSLERRFSYLVVAWDAFKERPLTGWGPDSFRYIYEDSDMARKYVRKNHDRDRPAHNTYLEVLIGTGLPGLMMFLLILLQALRDFTRARKTLLRHGDEDGAGWVGAYRLSLFGLLVFLLLFSDIYHKYLLLSLGLSQCARHVAGDTQSDPAQVNHAHV